LFVKRKVKAGEKFLHFTFFLTTAKKYERAFPAVAKIYFWVFFSCSPCRERFFFTLRTVENIEVTEEKETFFGPPSLFY